MVDSIIETKYPLSFRKDDAQRLGEQIRLRHSVELVGLKRVGISDFLRFFLYHKGVVKKYIQDKKKHLFVAVDLNDLVERELFPFWILTFKRLVDAVEKSKINGKIKKEIAALFLDSIQSRNLFLTIENLRKAIILIVNNDILPTVFFIRFDRLIGAVNEQFFANLEGLIDLSGHKLAYVFTSFRTTSEVLPKLPRNFLQVFANDIFVKPAKPADSETIFKAFKKRYKISPKRGIVKKLIEVSGGHIQYLHLAIVILAQNHNSKINEDDLKSVLLSDERIDLMSEEIWESLNGDEKSILLKIHKDLKINKEDRQIGKYLWDTGLVLEKDTILKIFSELFANFLDKTKNESVDVKVELSRKENLLYELLLDCLGNVCEREKIVELVWPEEEEMGVSDWTIDKLAARLRAKLEVQKSEYKLVTVKTRGFKLVKI